MAKEVICAVVCFVSLCVTFVFLYFLCALCLRPVVELGLLGYGVCSRCNTICGDAAVSLGIPLYRERCHVMNCSFI